MTWSASGLLTLLHVSDSAGEIKQQSDRSALEPRGARDGNGEPLLQSGLSDRQVCGEPCPAISEWQDGNVLPVPRRRHGNKETRCCWWTDWRGSHLLLFLQHLLPCVISTSDKNLNSVTWTRAAEKQILQHSLWLMISRQRREDWTVFSQCESMGWLGRDLHKYMLYKDQLKDWYLSRFHDCQMDLRADPGDTITCCWASWRRPFCCVPADSWLVCQGELQVKGTTKGERQVRKP